MELQPLESYEGSAPVTPASQHARQGDESAQQKTKQDRKKKKRRPQALQPNQSQQGECYNTPGLQPNQGPPPNQGYRTPGPQPNEGYRPEPHPNKGYRQPEPQPNQGYRPELQPNQGYRQPEPQPNQGYRPPQPQPNQGYRQPDLQPFQTYGQNQIYRQNEPLSNQIHTQPQFNIGHSYRAPQPHLTQGYRLPEPKQKEGLPQPRLEYKPPEPYAHMMNTQPHQQFGFYPPHPTSGPGKGYMEAQASAYTDQPGQSFYTSTSGHPNIAYEPSPISEKPPRGFPQDKQPPYPQYNSSASSRSTSVAGGYPPMPQPHQYEGRPVYLGPSAAAAPPGGYSGQLSPNYPSSASQMSYPPSKSLYGSYQPSAQWKKNPYHKETNPYWSSKTAGDRHSQDRFAWYGVGYKDSGPQIHTPYYGQKAEDVKPVITEDRTPITRYGSDKPPDYDLVLGFSVCVACCCNLPLGVGSVILAVLARSKKEEDPPSAAWFANLALILNVGAMFLTLLIIMLTLTFLHINNYFM